MAVTFLLLEITDPEVNALLWRLREIVSGRRSKSAIHMTVRGPYVSEPPPLVLEKARRDMAGDVLRIHGSGRFSNPDGQVVFVRVDSPKLREAWWKPSFPGFEPHISIYRGGDRDLADVVERFLLEERLEILCAEYRLVWHRSGQRGFFDANEPTVGDMQMLAEYGRLDPGIVDRFYDVVTSYRRVSLGA